jgi:hypothetical protein
MNTLQEFRLQKDELFAHHPQSPLTDEQKTGFKGLIYFPENTHLRYKVKVDEFANKERVNLQTSTGDSRTYERFGHFQFDVEGQKAELTIYSNEGEYFLPFADSLAGKDTYGAGRYLEIRPLSKGTFLIDFNYAYNPYCAYNDCWSCPLTPAENRLSVPIRGGEKIFVQHQDTNH